MDNLEEEFRRALSGYEDEPLPFAQIASKIPPSPKARLKWLSPLLMLFALLPSEGPEAVPKQSISIPTAYQEALLPKAEQMVAGNSQEALPPKPEQFVSAQKAALLKANKTLSKPLAKPLPGAHKPVVEEAIALQQSSAPPVASLSYPTLCPALSEKIAHLPHATTPSSEPRRLRLLVEAGPTLSSTLLQPNQSGEWIVESSKSKMALGFSTGLVLQWKINQKLQLEGGIAFTLAQSAFELQYHSSRPTHYEAKADSTKGPLSYTLSPVYGPSVKEEVKTRRSMLGWRLGISKKSGKRSSVQLGIGQDIRVESHKKALSNAVSQNTNALNHLIYAGYSWLLPWCTSVEVGPKVSCYISPQFSGAMKASNTNISLQARVRL